MREEVQQLSNLLHTQLGKGEIGTAQWFFKSLLKLLANGKSVSIEEIAKETGKSTEEVETVLAGLPSVERDEQGKVVGYGLTLIPTPHRFEVDGKSLYAWCALDTLMFPRLLGRMVYIESRCPKTGEMINLTVTPDRVLDVKPATTVVSIVIPEKIDSVRTSFCNEVHFFRSKEAASDWLVQHPEGKVVSVEEAFELARRFAERYEEVGANCCCDGGEAE
ncbi:organomercurial lyase MerB [Geobacillus stearothermophilus]|nr:organomercurial lyase MerB [Geobacillus stearothermophilus]